MGSQYVQTNGSVGVDVRMIDSRGECKFGRLEGVVCGKVDVEEKHTTLVWRLRWTENSSLDCENLVKKV